MERAAFSVSPVRTNADRETFIRFPWQVYGGDRHWVPQLLDEQREMLDRSRHPFHAHSEVEFFLAREKGEVVGRIAAIENRQHNRFHDERIGFFGFFESTDSPAVARVLLATAAQWARDRGLTHLRGPASFSTNEECGALVEGFDDRPALMMAYNPRFYPALLEGCGLAKTKDLVAFHTTAADVRSRQGARVERGAHLVRERLDVTVRPFELRRFERDLALAMRVYNEAWVPNWGFVPVTEAEARYLGQKLKQIADPELVLLALAPDGRPIGVALTMPDWNEAFQKVDGRLWPTGLFTLLAYKLGLRRLRRMRVMAFAVVPEFQRRGIDLLLLEETMRRGLARFQEAEFSWMLEDNKAITNSAEAFGLRLYKRYRMYEAPVERLLATAP
jgi:GNAT superfamily N-acetyltransferase